MKFTPITDPTRLTVDDFMIVPSEANSGKKPKLHVPPSSLTRYGLSVGETCRAANRSTDLAKLLTTDTGVTRVFYVTDAYTSCCYTDRSRRYEGLVGNTGSVVQSTYPIFKSAKFVELIFDDYTINSYREWVKNHSDTFAEGLYKYLKLSDYVNTCDYNSGRYNDNNPEELIRLFPDIALSTAFNVTSKHYMESFVPTTCSISDRDGSEVTASHIKKRFMSNQCFSSTYNSHVAIYATPKFTKKYATQGAVFLRPDKDTINLITRHATSKLMAEYARRHDEIYKTVLTYLSCLKSDMVSAKSRIKHGNEISDVFKLKKRETSFILNNLFK